MLSWGAITLATLRREMATKLKSFLKASAKGWQFAAEQPQAAADLLMELATQENPDLPKPLESAMVRESQSFLSQV